MNNAVSKKKTAEIIPFSSMFEEDKSKILELSGEVVPIPTCENA